jgi:hypothetical protein
VGYGILMMKQCANYMPETDKKMDGLIPKYYDYLRDSVIHLGSGKRQIIGNSSKNFFSAGKTYRPPVNGGAGEILTF